jgi:gamma-glutamyltranspeptidase
MTTTTERRITKMTTEEFAAFRREYKDGIISRFPELAAKAEAMTEQAMESYYHAEMAEETAACMSRESRDHDARI